MGDRTKLAKQSALPWPFHFAVVNTNRLATVTVPTTSSQPGFAEAVLHGLSQAQKTLPSRFFYDEAGSKLFDQITELPEYYLTRIDESILEANAEEIVAAMAPDFEMVEFGSGSSRKTKLLIEAAIRKQGQLRYLPIDISGDYLQQCAAELLDQYPELSITAIAGEYHAAIAALPISQGPRLFLFLGSNIGNFEHEEAIDFLSKIAARLGPQDRVLLGVDLAKDPAIVEPAYNDAAGITAKFNKNILARINAELGGDFELGCFEHWAPFVPEKSRIEMRLVSKRKQAVHIGALGKTFLFEAGEYIHTENSHKYSPEQFAELCAKAGLGIERGWNDANRWFGVMLLERAA